jgi:hypothetical protein
MEPARVNLKKLHFPDNEEYDILEEERSTPYIFYQVQIYILNKDYFYNQFFKGNSEKYDTVKFTDIWKADTGQ